MSTELFNVNNDDFFHTLHGLQNVHTLTRARLNNLKHMILYLRIIKIKNKL